MSIRISIITVSFNSAATIAHTINSVIAQSYDNIEYLVIDGNSTDGTQDIIKSYGGKITKFVSEKDNGMYDAINKGIRCATGDVIGLLNSDDFFAGTDCVSIIAGAFTDAKINGVYADVAFVKPKNLNRVVRIYSSQAFKPGKFKYGFMPAHPSFYVRKACFDHFGFYKTDYQIAADYELTMRFLLTYKIKTLYINKTLVYMQTGGLSNKNIISRYVLNKEIVRACKENGVSTNMALLSLKYFTKVFEFIIPSFRYKY